MTVKLNGFAVEPVRPLRVNVLVCPPNIDAGLNAQVVPEEHDRVMLPVKPAGADAETVKVADALPITAVVFELVEETEKTAKPVPPRATV